jgi:lysosomal Pro-X carboxypeptidase
MVGRAAAAACLALLVGARCALALHADGVWVPRYSGSAAARRRLPSTADCDAHYIEQRLDHFSFASNDTFRERYFVCNPPGTTASFAPKAIFFYCGNEASVELYVNATGLMWENAAAHAAALVFAEHRFYGKSLPSAPPAVSGSGRQNRFLSHELALADYATLLAQLRRTLREKLTAPLLPAVAFGGSYGGKLAAWLRMKYPHAVVGSIAASAPLLAFRGEGIEGMAPTNDWDSGSYYAVITDTAKSYSPHCASNIAAGIEMVSVVGATAAGRRQLQLDFGLCAVPQDQDSVSMLRYFLRDAFDSLAMVCRCVVSTFF